MPAGHAKIDLILLDRMLREGKSPADCARFFCVSRAAVCKAMQRLKTYIVRTAGMDKAAQCVEAQLDMMGQLRKVNTSVNAQLDKAEADLEACDPSDKNRLREIVIKLSAEVRKQMRLYLDVAETWHDQKIVAEFQRELIGILGEIAPDARKEFIKRIKQKQLVRGVTQFPRG